MSAEPYGISLTLQETANYFPKLLYQFTLPPATYESSRCSIFLSILNVVSFVNFNHSTGSVDVSHCGFNFAFP